MNLTSQFASLFKKGCAAAFAQERTCERAVDLAKGALCSFGRRTISRAICALGRHDKDWSADYKLFSRSSWKPERMFDPVIQDYLERYPEGPVCSAMDDTKLARSGRKIPGASWHRDPLSPAFHVNFLYGLRFMQSSLLYPHYREGDYPARAVPVRFTECPVLKKPGKKATDEERKAWREEKKTKNLSCQGLAVINDLRASLDAMGASERTLLEAADGSLTNRTIFGKSIKGVEFIGRCRKDARLCLPAAPGSRRKYDPQRFTPQSVQQDAAVPWLEARVHFGGAWRDIRYKERSGVLWRRGAGTRSLRLFVIAPVPYRLSPNAQVNYRQPAYLLATSAVLSTEVLLQCYFDRWQIEVNHRDEKQILGVGQAQVWSAKSVPRQPAFVVAAYSLLLLAGLQAYGPGRTDDYVELPKWRRKAKRASALDLVTLLRKEINEASGCDAAHSKMPQNMAIYAYT
jgi:hypothetical protein